jgi:hypothetical protein
MFMMFLKQAKLNITKIELIMKKNMIELMLLWLKTREIRKLPYINIGHDKRKLKLNLLITMIS